MTKWTAWLVGLGLGAGISFAADMPPFDQVDVDQDGKISKAEASAVPGLNFSRADKNSDGYLSQSEYVTATG